MRHFAAVSILLLAGCTKPNPGPLTVCAAYIRCLDDVVAIGGAAALAYQGTLESAKMQLDGPGCDQSISFRAACDADCTQGLASVHAAYPSVLTCGPASVAGGPGPTPDDLGTCTSDCDAGTTPISMPDLSSRPIVPADMSNGQLGCGGFVTCAMACTAEWCIEACKSRLDTLGASELAAFAACAESVCTGNDKCFREDDVLYNLDGSLVTPHTGTCGRCLDDASAGLGLIDCPDPGSPNCKPAYCLVAQNACLGDP